MLTFHSGNYHRLCVYLETEPDEITEISLMSVEETVRKKGRRRERVEFSLIENMVYTLSCGESKIGLAYLFDCADINDRGVRLLDSLEAKTKCAETYHFSSYPMPFRAVSAACFYEGYYHLFFRFNPFSEVEETMYWGHAVSRDMLSWHHLPILLEPENELVRTRHRFGGPISGCAEVLEDRVRLYATRLIGDKKTGKTLSAYQVSLETRDLLHISPEKTDIAALPPKADADFRSPKITAIQGKRHMVLGGTLSGKGAVFLYRALDEAWEYAAPLYVCKLPGVKALGEPDFFSAGRTHVLLSGLSGFVDKDGVTSPVYWFSGNVREGKLKVRKHGRMDFGGDFYAPSAFLKEKRRLLFATTALPCGEKAAGCLALPREVFWKKGRLFMRPAEEVYSLLGEVLYSGKGETVSLSMENAAFYVRLSLSEETPFRFMLGKNKEQTLFLVGDEVTCAFEVQGENGEKRMYDAGIQAENVEIFADCDTFEVFINGGEAAGTKRFCAEETVFSADFLEGEKVELLEIRKVMM